MHESYKYAITLHYQLYFDQFPVPKNLKKLQMKNNKKKHLYFSLPWLLYNLNLTDAGFPWFLLFCMEQRTIFPYDDYGLKFLS